MIAIFGMTTGSWLGTVLPRFCNQFLGALDLVRSPSLRPTTVTARESDVAQAVWDAVNDRIGQLRFPAGVDTLALAGGV